MTTQRTIMEANQPFSVTLRDGTPLAVHIGDRYWSDDPVVRGRESLFRELTVRSTQPRTETATAAPDERRDVAAALELDALRQQAADAGVKVDNRWGAQKLRAEIDKASKVGKPEPKKEA